MEELFVAGALGFYRWGVGIVDKLIGTDLPKAERYAYGSSLSIETEETVP